MEQICREKAFNVPNTLTVSRMLLIPAAVCFYRAGSASLALFVYLAAMLTDALDGWIARRTNQITTFGKLLDPLADKVSLIAMLMLLYAEGAIPQWVLALLFIRELMMIAGSVAALKHGIIVYALPVGKATTAVFTVSITAWFAGFDFLSKTALQISIALSLLSLLWYALILAAKLRNQHSVCSNAMQ